MKKVIIAIERVNFNNLYKYNKIAVSPKNILKINYEQLLNQIELDFKQSALLVEEILPYFNREEDNVLLEVDSSKIDFEYSFPFSSVHRIIPLNQIAKDLVEVKLNADFKIEKALTDEFYKAINETRELKLRSEAAEDVLNIFNLNRPNKPFIYDVNKAVASKLRNNSINNNSTISVLINFDTTPSGIPSGNVEALIKIIATGLLKAIGRYDTLRKSPLYKSLYDNYIKINNSNKENAFKYFNQLETSNRESFEKLYSVVRDKNIEGEIFKFCYYFFLVKINLLKGEGNLDYLKNEISDIDLNQKEFSQALYLVAFVQSYNLLFESIHRLKFAPLFGKKKPKKVYKNNSANDTHKTNTFPSKHSNENEVSDEPYNSVKENTSKLYENTDCSDKLHQVGLFDSISEKNEDLDQTNKPTKIEDDNLYKKALEIVKNDAIGGKEIREILENLKHQDKNISYNKLKEAFENEKRCQTAGGSLYKKAKNVLEIFK